MWCLILDYRESKVDKDNGLKIIQNRLFSPSHDIDGSQSSLFQCMASSNANPNTNINRPSGRSFVENLRTGTSPENSAIYSPRNIRSTDGRILTSRALDAAEGEDGTVKKETLNSSMPEPPKTLPILWTTGSFRNWSPMDRNTTPKGAQSKRATLSSFSMLFFHRARLMNIAANLPLLGLFFTE